MIEIHVSVKILAALWLLWNIICFIVAAADKIASKREARRIPERFFLWAAFLLGGPGVLTGFYLCRHKTRHTSLLVGTWFLTLLSLALTFLIYTYIAYHQA